MTGEPEVAQAQRIDRWLWHARLVRTRAACAALARDGHVRVNGERIHTASRPVRPGDVLTVALPGAVRVVRVVGFAERRGGAADARPLFEEIAPAPSAPVTPHPHPGGRPTKRDRRALERLRDGPNGAG